jgi:predicted ATPase
MPQSAVDALEFERLVREAGDQLKRDGARRARHLLATALASWRGRPFGEVGGQGSLGVAAERLGELHLLAIEGRVEADLALGRGAELVDELEALVREHPFRERLWRHLMLALYRAGRQADALAAYHRARAALDDELGIEPGPELRDLEAAILRQDVPEVARTTAQTNLHMPLTSFIGRRAELDEIGELVRGSRLVTLTGVGGVGKTRLATEVARAATEAFDDGVWFVDQAPLADGDLVASNVARVLGISQQAGTSPVDAILQQLGDRELLIVLDNCEHLRDACAELAVGLLARAPGVHILATSRLTLGIPSEIDYAVPPLALSPTDQDNEAVVTSDAVALFVERARAARPSLPGDAASLGTVAQIVGDLDGLPLAIELAAARAKALTISDIAAGLDDRFRFLVSWRRLSSARHRTLAEAMAWSFDLLEPDARILLADLSVFSGSFALDAIAVVSLGGDRARALDLVQRLVDASLVILEADPQGGSRYRLLETVRQYGAERLAAGGRTDAARRAHAEHFADLAEATPLKGPEQARGMARLDLERDNLRAAIDHAVALGDQVLQRRITAPLWRYWEVRGFLAEGKARIDATLAHGPAVAPELYPNAVAGAGMLAWAMGDHEEGRQRGLELIRLSEASGSKRQAYVGNRLLSSMAYREHDYDTSEVYSLKGLELARELGDPIEILTSELNHAVLLLDWGKLDVAVPWFERVLERCRTLGHREGIALALLNLAEAAFLLGDDGAAQGRFEEARAEFDAIGFRSHVGHATQGMAAVAARRGDARLAAELMGRAGAVLAEVNAAPTDFNSALVAGAEASVRQALGDEGFKAAYDAGWAGERRPVTN